MYLLRLHRFLSKDWRGKRYVRGHVYEVHDHAAFIEMLGSGLFQEAYGEGVTGVVTGSRVEIVVIRDGGLGDVLMALPPTQEFARRHPEIRVSFATSPQYVDLLAAQPGLERVYSIEEIPARVQTIDLRWYVEHHRDARHVPRQALFAAPFGLALEPAEVFGLRKKLTIRPEWVSEAVSRDPSSDFYVSGRGQLTPFVVLAARASSTYRSLDWPLVEEIAEGLVSFGARVAVTDPDPAFGLEGPGIVNLAGKLSITDLAGLISIADLVIAPDTGVLHLAAHIGKPVVGMFTTWPAKLRMQGYDGIAVEPEGLLCCPCFDHVCAPHWCSVLIDPDHVVAAAQRILSMKFHLVPSAQSDASSDGQIVFGNPWGGER